MTLHLDLATHATVVAVRRLLGSTGTPSRSEAYAHLGRRLRRFAFWKRYKAGKGVLRACSHHQVLHAKIVRRVAAYLADWPKGPSRCFRRRHTTCSPIRSRWTCRYGHSNVFGDARYKRLTVI